MNARGYITSANLNLFLFVFLMVTYWGYEYVAIPEWLHTAGRFHLLLLHLPIGAFAGCLVLYYGAPREKNAFAILYEMTILSALMAAIAGLFLAKAEDYQPETVAWHKHLGVAFASLLYIGKALILKKGRYVPHLILGAGGVLLLMAGHKGGEITHGKNYLFTEYKVQAPAPDCSPESSVYESLVRPVFEAKCVSCHRPQKRKGGLALTDTILLEQGSENGAVIDRINPSNSTIMKVITLPVNDEYHMPPEGKAQLTEQEKLLVETWLEEGASFHRTVGSYAGVESFQVRCQEIARLHEEKEKYSFPAASRQLIETLQNEYLSLQPVASGSPALVASFFVASEFKSRYLEDLLKVREQLVQLDLSYMPLEEDDLRILPEFSRLEKLSLNFTSVTEEQLIVLDPLPMLHSLSIAGIETGEGFERYLEKNASLRTIYLGTVEIDEDLIKQWEESFPHLVVHHGTPSKEVLPLTAPAVTNKKDVYQQGDSIFLSSPVPGTLIKYTLDGSLPDSLHGMVYENGIPVNKFSRIWAIALKAGWATSPALEYHAFLEGMKPDSVVLYPSASDEYPGEGVSTFFDNKKAEIASFRDKKWIAFREKPLVLDMYFTEARSIDSLILSYGKHIPAYVFPPSRVSLTVKDPSGNWVKVAEHFPESTGNDEMGSVKMSTIVVQGSDIRSTHFKLKADNLARIPAWHPGKGQKGWLFVDEIFIY